MALADAPVLVLVNAIATGLQPPGLSVIKLAVSCAVVVIANNAVHANKRIRLLYFTGSGRGYQGYAVG